MSDLEFGDTPALDVLSRLPGAHGLNPADITAAQDVLRLSKKLLGGFGELFAMHGLSPGRYALLMALYAASEPLAPSALANRLAVTRATVTGLVSGMVRDGLIVFAPGDTADRRRKAVALTDRGRALLGEVVPDVFQQMAALLSPLTGPEKAQLLTLLGRIENGLSA